MNVDGISVQDTQLFAVKALEDTEPIPEENPQQLTGENPPNQPEQVEPATEESQENEDEKLRGVIRLLLEGHFKGVADVRLRINFHDELAAIENEQLKATAEGKIDGVVESVDSALESLTADDTAELVLTEELPLGVLEAQEGFAENVNQLKEEFLAAEAPSITALLDGIQSAFDGFVELLQSALEPDTTEIEEPEVLEEVTNEETGTEASSETTDTSLAEFIESLRGIFDEALERLANELNSATVLPELSEPSGNGVAYEKFLAIYNELYGFETVNEQLPEEESVDSVV